MNKETFEKLLDKLEEIYAIDERENTARERYFNTVYPDSYPPYKDGYLTYCIDTVKILYPEIGAELDYYFYEAKGMEQALVETKEKEYDFTKRSEFLQYLIDENLTNKTNTFN